MPSLRTLEELDRATRAVLDAITGAARARYQHELAIKEGGSGDDTMWAIAQRRRAADNIVQETAERAVVANVKAMEEARHEPSPKGEGTQSP